MLEKIYYQEMYYEFNDCIILGAGLDTFSLRLPIWAQSLRIIEVDHPASQRDKLSRLVKAGIDIPKNVQFVEINFTETSLEDGLKGILIKDKPVFFVWLGVMMYLKESVIDEVLTFIGKQPKKSELVLSWITENSNSVSFASTSMNNNVSISEQVAAMGEPFVCYF